VTDEFVNWLRVSSAEVDVDFEGLRAHDRSDLGWFRQVYDELGPISPSRLGLLLEEARGKSSEMALEIMTGEVQFHHKTMFNAQIEERPSEWYQGRRGFYFLDRESRSWTIEDAILDIGDTVQAEIAELDWEVWPVCELHGVGLHLQEIAGQVVWWCRPESHAVRVVYPK
jgi:hypothetical protein